MEDESSHGLNGLMSLIQNDGIAAYIPHRCVNVLSCNQPLRKHAYSNTLKILPPKNGNFSDKKF